MALKGCFVSKGADSQTQRTAPTTWTSDSMRPRYHHQETIYIHIILNWHMCVMVLKLWFLCQRCHSWRQRGFFSFNTQQVFGSFNTYFNAITGLAATDKSLCVSLIKYLPQLSAYFCDSCVVPRLQHYIVPINQIWHAFTQNEVKSFSGFRKTRARLEKLLCLGSRVGSSFEEMSALDQDLASCCFQVIFRPLM